MEIRQLYKSILSSLQMQADENGMITLQVGGEKFPATCNDKRLVLPTQEVLRTADWNKVIAFHPLSENILRGESAVLKKLRGLVVFRVCEVITCLMTELTEIAADKDNHKKLSPTQSEFLSLMPKADAKTVKAFDKIFSVASQEGDHRVCSIYLKRGGHWKGNKYSRLAVTSFPITEDFDSDESEIFGQKLRKADKDAFKALFLYLLPNADSTDLEEYSHGSNSMTAPYFHALMKAYIRMAKQLNKITYKFRKHLDNPDELLIDVEWEEALEDLSIYKDLIPSLSGNEGEPTSKDGEDEPVVGGSKAHLRELAEKLAGEEKPVPALQETVPATSTFTRNISPFQTSPVVPTPAPAPAKAAKGSGLDWHEVVNQNPNLRSQYGSTFAQSTGMQYTQQQPAVTRGGYAQPQTPFGRAQSPFGGRGSVFDSNAV